VVKSLRVLCGLGIIIFSKIKKVDANLFNDKRAIARKKSA